MSPTSGLFHSAPGMEKTLSVPTRPVQLSQVMLAGMLCMALLGAATTYYGPTLVYVAAESNQPIAAVGVVFAMHGAGFFLSTRIANRLARRFEMRRAVAIPLVVAAVAQIGLNWRAAGVLLLGYVALAVAVVLRWPEFAVDHGGDVEWRAVPWRSIALFVAMFVVYVGVESAVGGWATTFFSELGQGLFVGALATSAFFLALAVGRLLFGSSVERLGYGSAVRLSTGLGAGALLLTFSPRLALLGFGLAGLTFSVVFTTMLAWAARRHPALRAQMASVSIASAGLGSMFVPSLIGVAVGAVGAWSLTPILIGTALVVAGLSFFERGRV